MDPHSAALTVLDADLRRLIGTARVQLWDSGGLHTTSSCPAASGGRWAERRALEVIGRVCPVCSDLLAFCEVAGRFEGATAALALHLRAAEEHAERDGAVATTQAGIHVAAAHAHLTASSRAYLSVATQQALAAVTGRLERLEAQLVSRRSQSPGAVALELFRRHLVAGGGPADMPPSPSAMWAKPAWRALRWAIRTGVDPAAAARSAVSEADLATTNGYVAAWLDTVQQAAEIACAGPRHLIAVVATAPVEGSRTRPLAALGALVPDDSSPKATCVPAQLISTLGSPGVRVIDAGPVGVPFTEEAAVQGAYLGLWDPAGSGPLSDPSAALTAARVVLAGGDATATRR